VTKIPSRCPSNNANCLRSGRHFGSTGYSRGLLSDYLTAVGEIYGSGHATAETSYYPGLAELGAPYPLASVPCISMSWA
jgi:hypothetical protein